MLTIDDIKYVSFRKSSMKGYRADEVDSFIDDVQETVEHLIQEKMDLEKKLSVLATQVKKYRDDEESLKNTLLNAQKLSENSLKEAKQKHDEIIESAKKNSNNIIEAANTEAKQIISKTKTELENKKAELYEIKKESVNFRTKLIKMYKEHLKLIDSLPNSEVIIKKVEENNSNEDNKTSASTKVNIGMPIVGSIEKVNEEISKLLKKENSENKTDVTSSKEQSEQKKEMKFEKLKFGENYK